VTNGWAGPVEHALEHVREHGRNRVRDTRENCAEREPPAGGEVRGQPDRDDYQALHPPVGEVDEDLVERVPVDVLKSLDDIPVPTREHRCDRQGQAEACPYER